jgi:hypothetical protein
VSYQLPEAATDVSVDHRPIASDVDIISSLGKSFHFAQSCTN